MNWPASKPRDWPLAAKVLTTLALTLLPLGVFAVMLALRNYHLIASLNGSPSAVQVLSIGLPVLMWLAAMLIGWIIASRLIVRPLRRLRGAVERYTAGDKSVRVAGQSFFSREVDALATAFDALADDAAAHETDLNRALAEQRRLTREVHHRVKNNLQIVSSLLSIQSRDTENGEVALAYSTIQGRVAALAIVHRWMYESDSPGTGQSIDLCALTTDLSASLEQNLASSQRIGIGLDCDIERIYVDQDTAVPLAFLVTEMISDAARLSAPDGLEASIRASGRGEVGTLAICAPQFVGNDIFALQNTDPVSRIVQGVARQLRSPLRHDRTAGCYSIDFRISAVRI